MSLKKVWSFIYPPKETLIPNFHKDMNNKYILICIATLTLIFASCTRTANRTGPLTPYPEITADIDIGEQVRGEGTRAELLGFIRWGDPGV